jgi:putative ABC transport system permease protein
MLSHYLIQALRSFWRFRLSTAINIVGLSLGMVCCLATYVFLESLLHSDQQFANADRIYAVTESLWVTKTQRMVPQIAEVSPPVAKFLQADYPGLAAVARALGLGPMVMATDDRKATLYGAAIDPDFLKIFDLRFVSGDPRSALSASHTVIITRAAASRLFGTENVLGRHLLLENRTDLTISAVIDSVPSPSHMGDTAGAILRFDFLVPMSLLHSFASNAGVGVIADPDADQWGNDTYFTYLLLPKDGSVRIGEIKSGLQTFAQRHAPHAAIILKYEVVPLSRITVQEMGALYGGTSGITVIGVAFALNGLILCIACLNYANLSLAIASTRGKEIGMRQVLGASRLDLVRQHLVEAMLLGAAALTIVILGLVLALPFLNHALGMLLRVSVLAEPILWLMVLLLLVTVTAVGGAYPALVLSRVRPVDALRAGTVRTGPRFVPTLLVGVQFAAASFLLVAALLMLDQNHLLLRVGLRPDRDPVLVIANDINQLGVNKETLRTQLLADPRVVSVSAGTSPPWQSGGWHFRVQNTPDSSAKTQVVLLNRVAYDFFQTMGIDVLAGRVFDRAHSDSFTFGGIDMANPNGPRLQAARDDAVIIDRSFASEMGWSRPDEAVGKLLYDRDLAMPGNPPHQMRVIGVVENGYPRLIGPDTDSNMFVLSEAQASVPVVRIRRTDVRGAVAHVDEVWNRLVPKVPLNREFSDELFNRAYQTFGLLSGILTGLAIFAFGIAMMGLFGMALHVASRRRRELGIRKTLGASAVGLVILLLKDFSKPVIVANILVWPLALMAGRVYLSVFVQRASLTAWPFVLSLLITLAVAWVAVGGQAVRAAAVRPSRVLHQE